MLIKIIKKNKTKIKFLNTKFFLKKRSGIQKKVIVIKLNEYDPIKDSICKISDDHDQVYEIKFHGKPVIKLPLANSDIENGKEKNKINEIFFSAKGPTIKTVNPKNKDKNKGISISAKGIKPLNISSCVSDIEIQ